ncbi:hypothetical protein A2872_00150 [Candidatus Gottesmanbacteria bacterium RIFCSPHIGHO2_01_FULL_42_12]|uniref:Uncharacterized protein n=1 Tax=Candidatus Gottesmanbacteria bacterium RIFCSPHIGHO2_01_FULL_42_12 TaxID=1798377 RepID=A0A1F5Z3R4_9BACT|nr:MAG: hypothetical protein A2872_00150 [Candidatus Gottesmanbacteria bacterium RIFCSPHIGHO2_01_FULL_42_12]
MPFNKRVGDQSIADSLSSYEDLRRIAEPALDADKRRAREIISECQAGNYANFFELVKGWEKKELIHYFRVPEVVLKEWRNQARKKKK